MLLQTLFRLTDLGVAVVTLLGLALLAFVVSLTAAVLYRWHFKQRIPSGLAALFGVAAVALYLNTVGLLGQVIGGVPTGDPFDTSGVLLNLLTLLVAALVTIPGRRAGDTLVSDLAAVSGVRELDATAGSVVRTVGRVTAVELPDAADIGDMESYDPVPAETKEALGGKTLLFPRKESAALRDRLVTRIKEDYGVSYVDVEFDEAGEIRYLALGSRVAGIGPTLGPGTCAIAVQADPVGDAGPGDIVQVWTTGDPADEPAPSATEDVEAIPNAEAPSETAVPEAEPTPRRVVTAELRAVAGDTVTLAVDEAEVEALSADESYRLVTLPMTPRADREFASLLRGADETFGVVSLPEGSPLAGVAVGALDATVVAVRRTDGSLDTLPDRERALAAGERVYVLGRPDVLRTLESRAVEGE
ncbi:MAG: potassium transporter TrkA [Halolamina sp.]